jgi:hypothetical protein
MLDEYAIYFLNPFLSKARPPSPAASSRKLDGSGTDRVPSSPLSPSWRPPKVPFAIAVLEVKLLAADRMLPPKLVNWLREHAQEPWHDNKDSAET